MYLGTIVIKLMNFPLSQLLILIIWINELSELFRSYAVN